MYTNIGRIGKDLELTMVGTTQTPCLKFSMAFNYGFGDKKRSEWFNVIAWDKAAETINSYCAKGDMLFVTLEPKTSSWEKDGNKHSKVEWNIAKFTLIGGKKKEANDKPEFMPMSSDNKPTLDPLEDDNLPF